MRYSVVDFDFASGLRGVVEGIDATIGPTMCTELDGPAVSTCSVLPAGGRNEGTNTDISGVG